MIFDGFTNLFPGKKTSDEYGGRKTQFLLVNAADRRKREIPLRVWGTLPWRLGGIVFRFCWPLNWLAFWVMFSPKFLCKVGLGFMLKPALLYRTSEIIRWIYKDKFEIQIFYFIKLLLNRKKKYIYIYELITSQRPISKEKIYIIRSLVLKDLL